MMSRWDRVTPLQGSSTSESEEVWIYHSNSGEVREFKISVTTGKSFNVLSLKNQIFVKIQPVRAVHRSLPTSVMFKLI